MPCCAHRNGRQNTGEGLVFLLAGLALSGWGAYEGAYAAGWAGTRGTLTVNVCEVSYPNNASRSSRKNRRPVRCEGTFVSEDGRSTDAHAAVQVRKRYAAGTELAVQQTEPSTADDAADAEYLQGGMDRALRWFGAFFGGWVFTDDRGGARRGRGVVSGQLLLLTGARFPAGTRFSEKHPVAVPDDIGG
ncbi:hypothetical protein ACIBU0_26570 [Streptomyces sp. NPDC049627]|uniref:hypothetical protein n=1 Tax=Streptomyces sp. NPDC049627 TaxID=3365595 RepID=UPI00379AB139